MYVILYKKSNSCAFWHLLRQAASNALSPFVFKPSATPATVTVTGSADTFYFPEGSKIALTGAGAALSTIKYYKP